ncbi:hypothetical protein FJZ19_03715 [Candidatus Pacearchaeota archaeon]|nr:hypothetical protein [Candidatus Pacearchaeota archaeon]
MENHKDVCEVCLHPISNPICVECYLKHVASWLGDFGFSERKAVKILGRIRQRLPRETMNEYRCIVCGKNDASICMYCAFLATSKIFLKLNAPKKYLDVFLESSNFKREEDYVEN